MHKTKTQKNSMLEPSERKMPMQMGVNPKTKGCLHKVLGTSPEQKLPDRKIAKRKNTAQVTKNTKTF